MKEGRDIDKLFKDGLENPDLPFNDLDWDNLEEKLHPKQKRRIIPIIWFAAVAGIAAMLLVVFLFVKLDERNTYTKAIVKGSIKKDSNLIENNKVNRTTKDLLDNKDKGLVAINKSVIDSGNNKEFHTYKIKTITDVFGKLIVEQKVNANILANVNYDLSLNSSIIPVQYKTEELIKSPGRTKLDKAFSPVFKSKPRLVLSILAAPDLTSVQSSGKSALSGSFGAELTLFLTKRLSITSGAAYAKKIYDSDFSLYRPNSTYVFNVNPTNVHANCDVIDIPLNVNYKVFDNNRNSITVSTGLSSYLMLKEKYSYTYGEAYQKPLDYEVKNQNQHYLGIANVGVEFQHKINNNLSISARPFMKIPLTDIGYGNSKLSSTGVAVSVNMNLFKRN
ncbi:hypothetical protein ACFOG5_13540 [Pedobacter fastidiosus]|uniref:Outer membrane protein beta-barrel domain-containing protein n=1 Tax=Pedobacter fastidiosus TaxID=2765361 RepID=A0ABR7KLJ6_9SPHI|nr:hypothetical protein [Pedobacter fastidiosus]MBC6108947.1 hypothetical protein [Pedobacter fastidiosus]